MSNTFGDGVHGLHECRYSTDERSRAQSPAWPKEVRATAPQVPLPPLPFPPGIRRTCLLEVRDGDAECCKSACTVSLGMAVHDALQTRLRPAQQAHIALRVVGESAGAGQWRPRRVSGVAHQEPKDVRSGSARAQRPGQPHSSAGQGVSRHSPRLLRHTHGPLPLHADTFHRGQGRTWPSGSGDGPHRAGRHATARGLRRKENRRSCCHHGGVRPCMQILPSAARHSCTTTSCTCARSRSSLARS